ncbi:ribulokinase [Salisediminibacterium halotolerans]|uniref:Ribulokinase n=1 Tax=Salisediminibacterium halotolerans TaxID=517425 RepID=A0A1H9WKC8_9BACI|nr:ribulokinase [Salisediminibacterium haloalkalitolerans]SES34199.1 L-ribulokinase [Salisediminibacterium haloalkalitolerans]
MGKYAIGIDYGTQSGRAVLVSLDSGDEIADHVTEYPHGVMDETLPDNKTKLDHEWALQHPSDYIAVIKYSVPSVLQSSGIDPNDVIGLGIDFTACTMLPIDDEGVPICWKEEFESNPHSWVKLWKHHAAQPHVNKINEVAEKRDESFLPRFGGKLSSEWMLAKIYQTLDEAPEIYEKTDRFVEATDWVIMQMTGNFLRNSCTAGYKAQWHKQKGYPSQDFFKEIDPRLEKVTETKLKGDVVPLGTKAGGLTKDMAELTGLSEGLPIAVGNVDAHASMPAAGVVDEGKMVMAMGTSICHMVLGHEEINVEGMCGVVEDGIVPGYYGYEAGQSAVGDIFAWYVDQAVPKYIVDEAKEKGKNVHQLLEEKASAMAPGETGLLALDWWNGNRSVLVDTELSGMILGLTLTTKPEEIYRALLESTAYGTRKIVDAFHERGVAVDELYACGGLPQKNPLLMQIFADVTNRKIRIADSVQTPALGAAMFGSVAAGSENGGYDNIYDAVVHMGKVKDEFYTPIPENVEKFELIYQEYSRLHDYFGRGENDVMKRLKQLR